MWGASVVDVVMHPPAPPLGLKDFFLQPLGGLLAHCSQTLPEWLAPPGIGCCRDSKEHQGHVSRAQCRTAAGRASWGRPRPLSCPHRSPASPWAHPDFFPFSRTGVPSKPAHCCVHLSLCSLGTQPSWAPITCTRERALKGRREKGVRRAGSGLPQEGLSGRLSLVVAKHGGERSRRPRWSKVGVRSPGVGSPTRRIPAGEPLAPSPRLVSRLPWGCSSLPPPKPPSPAF